MKQQEVLLQLKIVAGESGELRKEVVELLGTKLIELANQISAVIGSGGKLLIAGNGGSAAMSSHLATEMVVRLTSERNRQSLPAISLSADAGIITACGNDFGFESIFARQVEGLASKGDMLLLMSTSGNSENLIRAVSAAREKKIMTAAFLGGDGGKLAGMVEHSLIIPHSSTQRIQEEHLFFVHQLVEMIERDLFA